MDNQKMFLLFVALIVMAILLIISFILSCISISKASRQRKTSNGELEEKIAELEQKIKELPKIASNGTIMQNNEAFSKYGIVKFDAFSDLTGSNSFSIALLNGDNSGFIITSIYGRDSGNTYIREVNKGLCDTKLLEEEKNALEKAINY